MPDSYRNSVLHAGTEAGLFRFPVRGLSWQPARSGLSHVPVLSLMVDAPNAVLYAGASTGVYFSIDGGENWQATGGDFKDVRALVVDPQINTLYAAAEGGVYRSSDGGTRWEAASGSLPGTSVLALVLTPGGVLYAGTEVGVYQSGAGGDRWQLAGDELSRREVRALVLDVQTGTLYAGTNVGLFRSADGEKSWQGIGRGLPNTGVSSLALDPKGVELYAGLDSGEVFRSINRGEDWQPVGVGLPDNRVLSLAITPASGALYAGTEGEGVYFLAGDGGNWQPLRKELFGKTVYALLLTVDEQAQPPAGEILSGGLYWQERYPVEPPRLEASREALATLRSEHDQMETRTGKTYPWRLGFFPSTGLPALLRTFLPRVLPGDEAEVSPKILDLLTPTQAQAIFGLRGEEQNMLEQELEPAPIITLNGGEIRPRTKLRHFVWQQVFKDYPVIGGSVRVHGMDEDERIAVTSSYFPIPANYQFSPDPIADEDPLAPRLTTDQARQRVLEVLLRDESVEDKHPFLAAQAEHSLAQRDHETLVEALVSLQEQMAGGLGRWLIRLVVSLLRQGALLRWLGMLVLWLIWPPLGLDAQAALFEPVPIEGRDLAIMAFTGAYHLVSRIRIRMPTGMPWHLEVDMKTGQVLGQPWQTAIYAPNYYRNSREAMPGGLPTGNATTIDVAQLRTYVAGVPTDIVSLGSAELTNVAAHAQRLHDHLVSPVCGVPSASLEGYRRNGVLQSPGLSVDVNSIYETGFDYDDALTPKVIRFQQDGGGGIPIGGLLVYAPALDPEVVMHEFAHGFLWLLNSEPWDVPPTPGPFGRALQEGYAMYLARSRAAQEAGEEQQIWARAAYPSHRRFGGNLNWDDRWALRRSKSVVGADLLPAPNFYPSGSYSLQTPAGYDLAYDVGMVWARALWDLRELLGRQQADFLAVQAYPYLHGYIANFELAAEGLLDADVKLAQSVNLANGSQPIWAIRGIAAGQGVHGFAQAASGTLIAASDAGILTSANQGASWGLEQNNFAGGSLTGVVAVAAYDDTLYAAVQMPVFDTAGNNTQWQPNIFFKNLLGPGAAWQPRDNWPADTGEATPLSLLSMPGNKLYVGTSQGVYHNNTGRWLSVGNLANTNNALTALGMVVIQLGSLTLIRACTRDSIRQISVAPPQGVWSLPGTGVFNGASVRPTGIVEWSGNAYVGTLANGLWRIEPNFTTTQILNTSDAILALAARGTQLYIATERDVLFSSNGTNFVSRGLPDPDAKVISLFVTASGHLLAGTLAHGIWRHAGNSWQPVYTPPRPSQITLKTGEKALLSFVQPQASAVAYLISTPGAVPVQKVVKPGFPLQAIPRIAGRYTLPHGPIILLLENTGNAQVTLNVQVQTAAQIINIS